MTAKKWGERRSRSDAAALDMEEAEIARQRAERGTLTFRGVRAALAWYFEARERLQGPQGVHPRGETGLDGGTHVVRVDGGVGGDLDGVLVTISTIGAALERLRVRLPRAYEVLVARIRDGQTYRELEEATGLPHTSLSVEDGRGEAFLLGLLDGVVT